MCFFVFTKGAMWNDPHSLGPLHTQAKSHDHEMVRALDYHPKAVAWVLGKPFCVVMGPQT